MPDITVVIPVYNVEKYLKKCVDSVLHQTYKNYEIILVDDGSADSSGTICDELSMKNGNVKVIHQENMGLGGARNTGIKNCNTEYIIFLDSDDYIHPELLEKCIQTLKTNKCDIVLFDMVSVDENGAKGSLYTTPFEDSKILSKVETVGVCIDPSACDKAYRTSLFRDNDIYFPNKVWYEDLRTIPKLLAVAEGVMKIRSEPLYYYLQRSDSIMHTPDYNRMVRERMAAANDLYIYFRKYGVFEEYLDMLDSLSPKLRAAWRRVGNTQYAPPSQVRLLLFEVRNRLKLFVGIPMQTLVGLSRAAVQLRDAVHAPVVIHRPPAAGERLGVPEVVASVHVPLPRHVKGFDHVGPPPVLIVGRVVGELLEHLPRQHVPLALQPRRPQLGRQRLQLPHVLRQWQRFAVRVLRVRPGRGAVSGRGVRRDLFR